MAVRRPLVPRDTGEHHRAATPLELLFDLVFVVAIASNAAQLHHGLSDAHYEAVVATNATDPDRVAVVADETDFVEWVSAIVDAAEWYAGIGLSLDALVADKTKFKALASLTDTIGRPLMIVSGEGDNTVGRLNPKALTGDLAGVNVRLNLKQTTPGAAFVNGEAIRQYNGPVVELADENIVNLSKQFGVYYYAANATEIPGAIVPVVATLPAGVKDGE